MGKVNIKQLNVAPASGYVIGSGAGGVPVWQLDSAGSLDLQAVLDNGSTAVGHTITLGDFVSSVPGRIFLQKLQPASTYNTMDIGGTQSRDIIITVNAPGTPGNRGTILFQRSKGTNITPLTITTNDEIGGLTYSGHDGTSFQFSAQFNGFCDAPVSSGNVPTGFRVLTGTNSGNRTIRMTIPSGGGATIGTGAFTATAGVLNADVGFRIANSATLGNVLQGNGTNFVSSQLGTLLNDDGTGVFEVHKYIDGALQLVGYYDTVQDVYSNLPPVYLVTTGQSNALPNKIGGDNTPSPYTSIWNNDTQEWQAINVNDAFMNPVVVGGNWWGIHIGREAELKENRIIRIVYWALNAQQIQTWVSGAAKTSLDANIPASGIPRIDAVIWWQGESNSGTAPATYESDFNTVRANFAAYAQCQPNSRWIVCQLIPAVPSGNQNVLFHRLSIENDNYIELVETQDLPLADASHINGPANIILGKRIWDAIQRTVKPFEVVRAVSVIGNPAVSDGTKTNITATSNGQVLNMSGGVLNFSTLGSSSLAANSITDGLIRQSAGLSVIGRSANSTGNVADITAGTDLHVLRRSGTSIGFGLLTGGSMSLTANYVPFGVAGVMGSSANLQFNGAQLGVGGAPSATLDVHTGSGGAGAGIRIIQNANNGVANISYSSIDFQVPTTGLIGQFLATASNFTAAGLDLAANSIALAAYNGQLSFASSNASGYITFHTGGYALANRRMTITSAGNIGIGTTAATSRLDVAGDIETTSTNAFYLGDPTTDGTWRIIRSGNDLLSQRRESGSYVTKQTITP